MKNNCSELLLYPGYDCLSACITNAGRFFGYNYIDEDVYFWAGDRTIFFDRKKENNIYSNSHKTIVKKLKHIGMNLSNRNDMGTDNVLNYLCNCFKEGYIVIVFTSIGNLNYRDIYLDNISAGHYICLTNYDEKMKKIYILDAFIPNENSQVFQGWVAADSIISAWKEKEYMHYIVNQFNLFDDVIVDEARENFKKTIYNYLEISSNDIKFIGNKAVAEFLNGITISDDLRNVVMQIKIYGITTCKRYILAMLKREKNLITAIEPYKKIINGWDMFCLMLFKMHISGRRERLRDNINFAKKLCEQEYDMLSKIVDTLS